MDNNDLELGKVDAIEETTKSLVDLVNIEGNNTNQVLPSISMAPVALRDQSPSSFCPKEVSIGPLHREDVKVQPFEKKKPTYLSNRLSRMPSPKDEILKSCAEKVHTSIEKIKSCYVWTKTYNDAEITQMMVMDTCFILEFMLQVHESLADKTFMGKLLFFQTVMYDLALLENQIPFFILDDIFECTILKLNSDTSLVSLIRPVLVSLKLFNSPININNMSTGTTHHILSLLHQCYKPQDNISSAYSDSSSIPSAANLDRTGVKFEPNRNSTWQMAIEVKSYRFPYFFWSWRKFTLRMPVLIVADYTESILRNLIAYEQSCQTRNYITSYAVTMDMLVDTSEDVSKLVESKVLVNHMGSCEEAANMINKIGKNITDVDAFYTEQWKTLNAYCDSYWPKNIAWLRRKYFKSPWTMIALFVGIIIFGLTVVQTIFTITSG